MIVQIYEVQTPEEAVALARLRGRPHWGAGWRRRISARAFDGSRRRHIRRIAAGSETGRTVSVGRPRGDCAGSRANPAGHYPYRGGGRAVLGPRHAGAQSRIPGCADHAVDPDHQTRRASNAPMTIGGSPTFCCSTATSPATDRSAGLAARTTGASADALSTKWACPPFSPAASTQITSLRRLPQCGRRASIRKPRRTEPSGNGKDLDKVRRFVTAAKLTTSGQ